jgi:tetratricopeptide (TPR) repeat protein
MSPLSKRTPIIAAVLSGGLVLAFSALLMRTKSESRPAVASGSAVVSKADVPDQLHEVKALEAELQKKPNHAPILFRLAQLARDRGKPAEAIPPLKQILTQEPGNLEARLELGRALYDTGDVEGALTETNRILAENPKHVDALYNMGAINANLNKTQVARDYWTRAVAADPASESGKRAAESLQQLGAPAPGRIER